MENVESVMARACNYRDSFDHFSYLWKEDRAKFMENFLQYNHIPTKEEFEAGNIPESPPTLEQFKNQVFIFSTRLKFHIVKTIFCTKFILCFIYIYICNKVVIK